jgi:tetratricopeptide (TPR) repeat protein
MAADAKKKIALVYWQQGYEQQMHGELLVAIELYQRSLTVQPTAEAHTFLGWAYSMLGRTDEAIAQCQEAIRVDPSYGNPYNDIGAYLIEQGKLDDAIPYLEQALAAERYECPFFPHFNLGRVWERKGQWRRAIDEYETALRLNPGYTLAEQRLHRLRALLN